MLLKLSGRARYTYFLKYHKCVLLLGGIKGIQHSSPSAKMKCFEGTARKMSLQWNDSFLLSSRVKYKGSASWHLPVVQSSLHDNTPISERTFPFFNRWIQNISDEAAAEFLPQLLNDPAFVVAGWCVSAALWAAGKQHEKYLQASPTSGLQALQPQQEVPKAAPHQLTAWKVNTTDSLSPHCCDDKYTDT